MKAKDFAQRLNHFIMQNPANGEAEVYLRYDGETCIEYGSALSSKGLPGQHFLLLLPAEKGHSFRMREGRIN